MYTPGAEVITYPALLTYVLAARYLALQSVISSRLLTELQLQDEIFTSTPQFSKHIQKRRNMVYWNYASGREILRKHINMCHNAIRCAYMGVILGTVHCLFRIISSWDIDYAIVAAVVMWMIQFFIITSITLLLYDLYSVKIYFIQENQFISEFTRIIKKILKKREQINISSSSSYESESEETQNHSQ